MRFRSLITVVGFALGGADGRMVVRSVSSPRAWAMLSCNPSLMKSKALLREGCVSVFIFILALCLEAGCDFAPKNLHQFTENFYLVFC